MNIEISPMEPNSDGAKLAELFAKKRKYPEDYKGPKAGKSDNKEWLEVTEYQAFKHVKFEDWSYADFDCWLAARDQHHYTLGGDAVQKAFENMQKIVGIR